MRRFISAIQFITLLPVGKPAHFDPRGMVQFFPVVGILLGVLVAAFDQIVMRLWTAPVAALLDVILLIALTGAFHLDGLGDTADGLFGQRPKEKALAIMKDSRIGAMGLVAIVCGLALKWGGISGLNEQRSLLLIIVPAYARSAILFGMRFLEYGRPGGGTGLDFFKDTLRWSSFWGILIPVGLSLLLGFKAIWINSAFAIVTSIILWYYKKRLGCITGDMLGAMTEATESILFILVSIGGSPC